MLESELKRRCSKTLESWGWMVIHLIQTNQNGVPDTLILRRGAARFIEFKQPGKNPTELQKYRHEKLAKQGFAVTIVRTTEDILEYE